MVSIAKACEMVGVARSTLLYYERIGLITPERDPGNGYRRYSREDIHALILIRQLQKAGFGLKEAGEVMKGELDPDLILARYQALEGEIRELNVALDVLRSLVVHTTGKAPEPLGKDNPAGSWHAELEKAAGEAHAQWLRRLGFDEKEQLYIRWVTRNMNDSGGYMEDFFLVFENMKRQGPGSRASTIRGFEAIPDRDGIESILEVGCGKGQSSLVLAEISQASITAIDNHQPFLDHLAGQVREMGVTDRVEVRNMSMFDMAFPGTFDLIWSEGSAYFMGFEKALAQWKSLIRPGGHLFVSEAVWLTDRPSPDCADYFGIEYPAMKDVPTREAQARELGYEIVDRFILPGQDWVDFYDDMEACLERAIEINGMTRAYENMTREIAVSRAHGDEYGYVCLLLRPAS